MRIDEFVTLLEAVKPASSGYQARCPAHTDHTPSLSVSEGKDGRILVKDHAGCTTEQIVEAMNLTTTDLFPSDGALPQSAVRFVNTSAPSAPDYQPTIPWETVAALHTQLTDEQRRYLRSRRHLTDAIIDRYQLGLEERASERRLTIPIQDANGSCRDIRRWLPPGARQDGSQKMLHWRTGHGASRLFPADQLNNDAVVLCEGELDALALVSHALPAITATCGATTWPTSLSTAFSAKTVTLLMDHDRAGETGAQKRAESLYAAGAKVKVAAWPADRNVSMTLRHFMG